MGRERQGRTGCGNGSPRSSFGMRKDAPWDDEPLTADDKESIPEANADYAAGRVVSQEELRKELPALG